MSKLIILDLDGVLADFYAAANHVHGFPIDHPPTKWDWYHDFGVSDEEFWRGIHELGDRFYRDLVQPYPDYAQLVARIHNTAPYVIMTAPSDHPAGYAGKKIWVDKWLPEGTRLIVGKDKHLLASPDHMLIDDNPDNVERFRNAGGYAQLYPQPWNAGSYLHTDNGAEFNEWYGNEGNESERSCWGTQSSLLLCTEAAAR